MSVLKDENGKDVLIEKFIEYRPNLICCSHRDVENKNKAFISLEFAENCSENFRNQLETIIEEILGAVTFNYIPPLILFPELNPEKKKGMLDLCLKEWMPHNLDLVEIVVTLKTTP
uniref:Uncharacterized protein n=1 Tax=Panagrolaimus sp. PS1159 TaxID=55785 RepID=A0AC35GP93_9BILA